MHSTITSKGQTTIPIEIRERLHLLPGTRLEYVVEGDRISIRPEVSLMSLAGSLKSDKAKGLSWKQIRALAKKEKVRQWKAKLKI